MYLLCIIKMLGFLKVNFVVVCVGLEILMSLLNVCCMIFFSSLGIYFLMGFLFFVGCYIRYKCFFLFFCNEFVVKLLSFVFLFGWYINIIYRLEKYF